MKKHFVSVISESDVKKLFHTFMETFFHVLELPNPAKHSEPAVVTYPEVPLWGRSVKLTAVGARGNDCLSVVMTLSKADYRNSNKMLFEINLKSTHIGVEVSKKLASPAVDSATSKYCLDGLNNAILSLAIARAGRVRAHLGKYGAKAKALAKAFEADVPGAKCLVGSPEFFMNEDGSSGYDMAAAFNFHVKSGRTNWDISPMFRGRERAWHAIVSRDGSGIENYGDNWFDDGSTELDPARWDKHLLEIMIPIMRADLL